MAPVAVVMDSTHYLPPELVATAGIHEVSLYVRRGEELERESEISDLDAFYASLGDLEHLPTTSQPSVGDFLAVYEPLLDAGHDLVSLHLPAGLSGTVEAARQAAQEAVRTRPGRRVEVVDAESACGGLGIIALAAAASARGGADVDGVVARAHAAMADVVTWFAVDTLEYLRRGGRIGGAQALLGSALQIKPILTFRGQELAPVERVRTSRRAFERLVAFAEQDRLAGGHTQWAVQHIQAPERAEQMAARCRALFGHEAVFVSEIGPVIGTHVGPGLLGVSGVTPALLE